VRSSVVHKSVLCYICFVLKGSSLLFSVICSIMVSLFDVRISMMLCICGVAFLAIASCLRVQLWVVCIWLDVESVILSSFMRLSVLQIVEFLFLVSLELSLSVVLLLCKISMVCCMVVL
jgi:hypothetical protein